jgi:uncharacterized protein (DUF433 family)
MASGSPKAKEATSFRLSSDLMDELKRRARDSGVSATTLVERLVDEGLRRELHPLIAFRDAAGGRRAAVVGTRLDVAQVMDTVLAADEKGDAAISEAAEYLGLPDSHVRACVSYYAMHMDEVDEQRERMHTLAEREREAWRREQAVLA